jgi:hypothetical protein
VRRRALLFAAVVAVAAPASAAGSVQQVLLPGPTPYPTASPPLLVNGASPTQPLAFTVHAGAVERVLAGVAPDGRVVSVDVRHRLLLTGKGDYLIVIGAPVEGVQAGPESESQPGLRQGQILWSGFSPGRKLLVADAKLAAGSSAPFLPVRLRATRRGDGYSLTLTNATRVSEAAFEGSAVAGQLARLLDRTRAQSLARERLESAYATIDGLVRKRAQPAQVAAPLQVEGMLRFPSPPSSARGGTLRGRTVSFSGVLGDASPLSLHVDVEGGGAPQLRLVARPTRLVRALTPPRARTWAAAVARHPISARTLLRMLIEARMQLVRSDQYQAFLANPDPQGANRTTYVYESAAVPAQKVAPASGHDSGGGALVPVLAVLGAVLGAGAALVLWAHS